MTTNCEKVQTKGQKVGFARECHSHRQHLYWRKTSLLSQKRLTLGGLNNCNRVSSRASAAFSSSQVRVVSLRSLFASAHSQLGIFESLPAFLAVKAFGAGSIALRNQHAAYIKRQLKLQNWLNMKKNALHLPLSVRKLSSSEMWSKASKLVRYSRSRFEAMKPTTSFWRHCVRILSIKTSISAPAFPGAVL